ncbi:MAG: ABATE domain-containing protein [Burkholderiaceae bacterium]|jgi:predicted RNA-binding Zn ribbon-like protein
MPGRTPAIFIGDARALDFLNSVATPGDAPVDWIGEGEGLLDWLHQAALVPKDVISRLRAHARPGEFDKLADQARAVREWFRAFVQRHKGNSLTTAAIVELEPLNRLLERDEAYLRIVASRTKETSSLQLEFARRWGAPESLLLPIWEILAELVCNEDFAHIRACEGPSCTLVFADHTRGHARRWCSMAICGNRAKQAAHRKRLKAREVPRK